MRLELRGKVLGEKHVDTVASLGIYADALATLGRAEESWMFLKQALDSEGAMQVAATRALNKYAAYLESSRRIQEADSLYFRMIGSPKVDEQILKYRLGSASGGLARTTSTQ